MSNLCYLYARRCSRFAFLFATALLILVAFPFNRSLVRSLVIYGRYPPLYPKHRELEQKLPHYAAYEHSNVKYLWSPGHPRRVGWGNVMQDYILSYVLAYASNRSFVFDDYSWAIDGTLYSPYNGNLIPSRIPLSAFIDGPLAGGPLPAGDDTPRAVHRDFFYHVCPNPTILRLSDVGGWSNSDTVRFIIDKWAEKIASIEDSCLQFEETDPNDQLFNYLVFGQKERLLSLWPYLSKMPVLSRWGWSPLIYDAFQVNRGIVFPPALSWPGDRDTIVEQTMPGLLVIHLRRGDYYAHCRYLAHRNVGWNAFNSFPELPDKYDPISSDPRISPQNDKAFMAHCYPDIDAIVDKIQSVRDTSQEPLRYLYIMTNAENSWIAVLKAALHELAGWDHISSNRDLSLDWEQKFVAQAVDMLVAQKAQAFIGNGWSSLTSNIVMLRTADDLPPDSSHFW